MMDILPDSSETSTALPRRKRQAVERIASHWVARHALGCLETPDQDRFQAWLAENPAHGEIYQRLNGVLGSVDTAGPVVREADRQARQTEQRRSAMRTGIAVAIVGLLLVGSVGMVDLRAEFADMRTPRGEVREYALSDGSRLTLDADAAVNIDYNGKERAVRLVRGRIHAEVAHGDPRPFRVTALDGEARDIGTAFDAAREGDHVTAIVTQGEIAASSAGHWLPLRMGQGASWSAGRAPRLLPTVEIPEATSWRYGRVVFDRMALGDAIAILDRYSSKPIWLWNDKAATKPVSGVVRSAGIPDALDSLAKSQGLKVKDVGIGILIY